MHNRDTWVWTDPDDGTRYDLDHMQSFIAEFEVMFEKPHKEIVQANVSFSNHCWARSWKEGDDERHIVDRQMTRNGFEDIRVFCPHRWGFSVDLPEIIEKLQDKSCLSGGSQGILYRQECPTNPAGHDGWYICLKLAYQKDKSPPLQIVVRSAHHRTNRPDGVRGGPSRFYTHLKKFLEKKLS